MTALLLLCGLGAWHASSPTLSPVCLFRTGNLFTTPRLCGNLTCSLEAATLGIRRTRSYGTADRWEQAWRPCRYPTMRPAISGRSRDCQRVARSTWCCGYWGRVPRGGVPRGGLRNERSRSGSSDGRGQPTMGYSNTGAVVISPHAGGPRREGRWHCPRPWHQCQCADA